MKKQSIISLVLFFITASIGTFTTYATVVVPGYSCESKQMITDFDPKAMNIPVISFLMRDISKRNGSVGKLSFLYGARYGHLETSAFRPLVLTEGRFKPTTELKPRWVTSKSYVIVIEIDDPTFQSDNPQCSDCKGTLQLEGGGVGTGVYDEFNKEIRGAWIESGVQDKEVLAQMEKKFISGWYGLEQVRANPIELNCVAPITYN